MLAVGEADRLPGVVRIVDIGGIEVAGRGRGARRAVVDPAGLHHRPGGVADDHGGDRVSLVVGRRRGVARRVSRRDAGMHVGVGRKIAARDVDAERQARLHLAGVGGVAIDRQGDGVADLHVATHRAGDRNRGVRRLYRVDDVVAGDGVDVMPATGATVSTV